MSNEFKIFAAPLAGITDKPFRKIIRRFSPDVRLVTEMISCHSLVGAHKNCARNFDRYDDEGEIGAQIFGADAALMGDAAKILEDAGAKWIDINMGCPVPKVATRAGAGAFLMRDHTLAGQIVKSVASAVGIPVSVKTRLGWDNAHQDWADLIRIVADNGAAFATLHGRTRAAGYTGNAVLPPIKDMPIPIIANGDIKSIDARPAGYDGIMIGRAMLGKPWVFKSLDFRVESLDSSKTEQNSVILNDNQDLESLNSKISTLKSIVLEHLDLVLEYYGERAGVPLFRKHAAWYSVGMQNSAEFRTLVNKITRADELKIAIRDFFV